MLHASAWGDQSNGQVPLVLLHGFGGSANAWESVVSALSYRPIVAFDLPGHGGSLHADKTGVKASVATVLQELDRLGISSFHLVGHSMGGAAAALIALERPLQVQSLTLLAPGGFGPDIASELLERFAVSVDADAVMASLGAMYAPDNLPSAGEIQRQVEMRAKSGQIDALVSLEKRLSRDGRQGELALQALSQLPMPLHIIWGDRDPVVPFAQTETLPAHFTLHVLTGTGHMLMDEEPALVAQILQEIAI